MKLVMIGSGYVGLVSGVCFAALGHEVICTDKDAARIAQLNQGVSPIYEPGLEALMAEQVTAGRLSFSADIPFSLKEADAIFIAVGTPPNPAKEGEADLSAVFAAASMLAETLTHPVVIVTKSTVPVGTNRQITELFVGSDCHIVSNPEFLREGAAIDDFMQPDRIVIGTNSPAASSIMQQLYAPLTERGIPLLATDWETAEMIKYASNSFLATKIAFINEIADICEPCGANVEEVARGMGMDSRIGQKFLKPGPGFGGSCFPKDAMALTRLAASHQVNPFILNSVIQYNLGRRDSMAARIFSILGEDLHGKTIAVLGLTFKANTDDMRESASLAIIPALAKPGATLRLYDPQGMDNAKALLAGDYHWAKDVDDALHGADLALMITEWPEFIRHDWQAAKPLMRMAVMLDLRNLFAPEAMQSLGYDYYSIGRKPALANTSQGNSRQQANQRQQA